MMNEEEECEGRLLYQSLFRFKVGGAFESDVA